MLSRRQHPPAQPFRGLAHRRGSPAWHRLRHGCPLPGSASLANSCFLLAAVRAAGLELLSELAGLGQRPWEREARAALAQGLQLKSHHGPLVPWDRQQLSQWSQSARDALPCPPWVVGAARHTRATLLFAFLIQEYASTSPGLSRVCSCTTEEGREGGMERPWAVPDLSIPTPKPSTGTRRLAARGSWGGRTRVASQHMQAESERSPGSAVSSQSCAQSRLLEPSHPASPCSHPAHSSPARFCHRGLRGRG